VTHLGDRPVDALLVNAGVAVGGFSTRFAPGDEILVAVYPGVTMQVPDFTMSTTGDVHVDPTGTAASAGSIRVRRNCWSGSPSWSSAKSGSKPGGSTRARTGSSETLFSGGRLGNVG